MRAGIIHNKYADLIALTDSSAMKAWCAILLIALLVAPWLINGFLLSLSITFLITVIGVIGLSMLTGSCGLISLGHAGFMAIGAYANAILVQDYGFSSILAIFTAGLITALSSMLVGIPSLRLKGLYLAITTMAFTVITTHTILNADELTRGSAGIFLAKPEIAGFTISTDKQFYYFVLPFALLCVLGAVNIMRARIGRAFIAIRDQDIAASIMGINLVRTKLIAFAIAAFFTGISGALLSFHIRYINVDTFGFLISIEALAMIIVGGLGSIAGAILGTIFMIALPEVIEVGFDMFGTGLKEYFSTRALEVRGLILGVIIILVIRFEPRGLIGIWSDIRRRWENWPFLY